MLDTLSMIGKKINNKGIIWGIGGSLLLSFYELIDHPNDIDILVSENHAKKLNKFLSSIGEPQKTIRLDPFRTKYFSKFRINHTDIDMMGGFAIQHEEGVYQLSLEAKSITASKKINGTEILLCSLEDWYVLYWLIPGKQEKALFIESYLKRNGVHANLLEKALKQPLPFEVRERVIKLLQ